MASSISLGIVIGATMAGSVGSAFGNVSRQAQQLGERLDNIRLARNAGQDVMRLNAELATLRAQEAAAGGASAALAAEINRVETELNQARQAADRYGLELTDLAGETARLQQAEARLQRQLDRRNQLDANRNRRSELMGEAMGLAMVGAAFAVPIKQAVEYEKKNAELGAVLGENTDALQKQSRVLGKETSYSATEAAQAQIELAKAGLDSQKILGATPHVLSVAAGAQIGLGQAAEITADIMNGYGLKINQIGMASDTLVKTANLSTTSVSELGEAFKYVGGVASTVNVDFNKTNAMLGILSNNGIKGSQAGTSLRMAFIRLANTPKPAREALEKLGVSIRDSKGNFRDMITIMKEIDQATQKMGNAEKLNMYGDIFGAESATALLAIGKAASSGELQNFQKQLDSAGGSAAEMAKKMQATTAGALERMGGAFSDIGLTIGTILLPYIASAAESIDKFVSRIGELAEANPQVTQAILLTVGALIGFKIASIAARFGMTLLSDAVVFGKAVFDFFSLSTMQANIAIMRHRAALLGVAIQSRAMAAATAISTAAMWLFNAAITANPLGLLIIGIAAVAFAVIKYWEPIKAFATGLWDGLKMGLTPVLEALAPLQPIFSGIASAIGSLFTWLGQLFTPLNYSKEELASFAQTGQQMGMILGSAIMALIQVTVTLAQAFVAVGTAIGQGVAMGVSYFQQLHSAAVSLVAGFFEIGANIMNGLLNGLSAGYARVKAKVSEMANSIKSSFQSVLGIHSPSRVFAGYGENINEGLSIGMTASQHKPIGKAVQVADMMARGFEVNNPTPTFPVSNQTNNSSPVSSSSMAVTINVYQQTGENAEELANRISSIIQHNQEIKQRGSLYD